MKPIIAALYFALFLPVLARTDDCPCQPVCKCAGCQSDPRPCCQPKAQPQRFATAGGYKYEWSYANNRWEPCPVAGLRFEYRAGKWFMHCPCGPNCACPPGQCPNCPPAQTVQPTFQPQMFQQAPMFQGGGGGRSGGC